MKICLAGGFRLTSGLTKLFPDDIYFICIFKSICSLDMIAQVICIKIFIINNNQLNIRRDVWIIIIFFFCQGLLLSNRSGDK